MPLTGEDLSVLSEYAIKAAIEAGQLIASRSTEPLAVEQKKGGDSLASQVVTEIDYLSEALITKQLLPTCENYDIALLTEESSDDKKRLESEAFWCVDPLDGTLAFIESTPGYSVSIALVSKSGEPLIGVVYDPLSQTLYSAVKGQGAFRNGDTWQLDSNFQITGKPLTIVCDRSQVERSDYSQIIKQLESMSDELGLSGVRFIHKGGAVMNACWVLENRPACYFKFPKPEEGGGSLWDFAATACIFTELGAIASSFYGQPLDLNRRDSTFMNHGGVMFATNRELIHGLIDNLQGIIDK